MKKLLGGITLSCALLFIITLLINGGVRKTDYTLKTETINCSDSTIDLTVRVKFPDTISLNELLDKTETNHEIILVLPSLVYLCTDPLSEHLKNSSIDVVDSFLTNSANSTSSVKVSAASVDPKNSSILYNLSFESKDKYMDKKCTLILGNFQVVTDYNGYQQNQIILEGPYFETILIN